MRTGHDYLQSLADDRTIYVNGEKVACVTDHDAFRGVTRTIAGLYDLAADPASGMTYEAPETGKPANKVFMIPHNAADLGERREAIARWSRETNGLIGRGPDHVGSFLAGFASSPEVFEGEGGFYDNVASFYKKVLEEDLFVSYTIVPPQVDRSKGAGDQATEFTQVGAYKEVDGGIIVRGAQMLGTAATVSNYLYVSCIRPLKPDEQAYAISFVTPIATPGLKLYCRPPYAPGKSSVFDYPLSTRFDESDCLVVFDDCFIPWENVFIYRNPDMVRAHFFDSPAHLLGNDQALIRLTVKLQFLVGIARKVAALTRTEVIPSVQEKLADMASLAAIVEGMQRAADAACLVNERGVARPHPRFLYGIIAQQAELYPRVVHLLRDLVGGGVLQIPSSYKEVVNPETSGDIERYVRGGIGSSLDKLKLFRLAWDIVGSEFAGRHTQYEMFYVGAPHVAKAYLYHGYGWEEPVAHVDRFLATYDIDS